MWVGDSRPLLRAKLLVPALPVTAIARPRLWDRLDGVSESRLTTVVAPAGWGKTTLLAGWAREPKSFGRVGWLSLDEADDEPVRFWTYALSALDVVAPPSLTRDALESLRAPGMDPVGVALAGLLNALTVSDDRYALVLDDYQVLNDPVIHQSVEFLLTYLPRALHLVIASRSDPPLPLARMRARGELDELRVADLQCTIEEASELMGGVSDALVPTSMAQQLVDRTDGWAAGLHLAAVALRGAADPAGIAAELRGDRRHILDYFAAEVLPGLALRERDLLVRCSVLERLSGPLCDAVLGTNGAEDVLARLDRAGLFISDLGGGWYRCHRLFRDVLRRELDREPTPAPSALLGRAADWFLTHGHLEEAVEHRLAAGDHPGALELILTGERWFMDRGASAALLRLGERLAGSVTDARLFVSLAVAAGESGEGDRCAHWLAAAEPLIQADSDPRAGWRSLRAEADTVWAAFPAAGDARAALAYASRAVDLEDDPSARGYVLARVSLGGALLGAGRLPEAVEVLQEGWRSPARRDLPSLHLLQTAGLLAQLLIEVGDLDGARRISREVRDVGVAAEEGWGQGAAAAIASLRLAEARLVMATDPRAAIPALQRAAELAETWGWPTVVLASLCHLAAAQWTIGDRSAAQLTLDRATDVAAPGEARAVMVRRLEELQARIGRAAATTAHHQGALVEELTDRELAILRALRGPLSAREIGSEMYLSINTVKSYTKSLYRKLGVVSRAHAVRRGHELGLI
jgi:LuxR family maltose regulon positive regulatory protein